MRKLYLLLLISLLLVSAASADTVAPITILDQRGYMPSGLFMFLLIVTFITLIASYKWNDEMSGAIAIMTAFASMWTSRAVDYTTGVVINSSSDVTVVHTIYQPDILTLITGILLVIAILNEYRIYVMAKRDNEPTGIRWERTQ